MGLRVYDGHKAGRNLEEGIIHGPGFLMPAEPFFGPKHEDETDGGIQQRPVDNPKQTGKLRLFRYAQKK
jgi:hypothetical protein